MAVKLGSKVEDTITGFVGTAIQRSEHLSGCNQIFVQPRGLRDGSPIPAIYIEERRLIAASGERNDITEPDPPRHELLGKTVKCIVTGITGTVVVAVTPMYAAKRVLIQPKGCNRDGGVIDPIAVDEHEVIVVTDAPALPPPREVETGRPGGPMHMPSR